MKQMPIGKLALANGVAKKQKSIIKWRGIRMDHPDEKPDCVRRAERTVPARKRGTIQHKLRSWMEQEIARESIVGKHSRRRPKPSLPPTPWDNEK